MHDTTSVTTLQNTVSKEKTRVCGGGEREKERKERAREREKKREKEENVCHRGRLWEGRMVTGSIFGRKCTLIKMGDCQCMTELQSWTALLLCILWWFIYKYLKNIFLNEKYKNYIKDFSVKVLNLDMYVILQTCAP